jgi:hypothetical protein
VTLQYVVLSDEPDAKPRVNRWAETAAETCDLAAFRRDVQPLIIASRTS